MSLYHRLLATSTNEPDAVALIGADGVALSRAEVLQRAVSLNGPSADPDDPVTVVVGHLAAQASGSATLRLPTSGSSGRPRVIERTVTSWTSSLPAFDVAVGLRGDDVIWAPGTGSATLTLYAIWQALAAGVPVLASGPWRGVTDQIADAVRTVTVVQCVPVVLDRILDAAEADAMPRLRVAAVAGAGMPAALRERALAHGLHLVEFYGAAELSFVAIDTDGAGLRPFPGVEVDLREGVLWARSPYICNGLADSEGWASADDRAEAGPDGTLRIAGRGEDAVNVAGHTVRVEDVEEVLGAVPGVAELVCLAHPDAHLGERLVAVVRARAGADPLTALRAAAEALLPPPARPARYVVVQDFPRTGSGKVARATLRESLWS